MSTHDKLVYALQDYVSEHGSSDAIIELLSLTCYSVLAWHGLLHDEESRATAMTAAEVMSGAVESLDNQCFLRRTRQCN